MKIESMQVGLPKNIIFKGKTITTAIFKDPVPGPLLLAKLNLQGDKQAELGVHGGVDKALYAYSHDAYPEWIKMRPHDAFPYGALGENLTMDVLDEKSIFIGDTFQLGEAVVQVSEPRFPCQKLGVKFNDLKILKQFLQIGRSGVYFRVLKEGMIDRGDKLVFIEGEKFKISVDELFKFELSPKKDPELIKEILNLKSLPKDWQVHLNKILNKENSSIA